MSQAVTKKKGAIARGSFCDGGEEGQRRNPAVRGLADHHFRSGGGLAMSSLSLALFGGEGAWPRSFGFPKRASVAKFPEKLGKKPREMLSRMSFRIDRPRW